MHDANILGSCLVECDPAVLARARRARRTALMLSILLQALALTLLVLTPLLVRSERLPKIVILTPVPPYKSPAPAGHPGKATTPKPPPINPITDKELHFVRIPEKVAAIEDAPPDMPEDSVGIAVPGGGGKRDGILPPIGDLRERGPAPPLVEPSAPKPQARAPLKVSQPVQEGKLIHRVEPRYPAMAISMRLEGTVHLRAIIGRDGVVRSLEILSGHPVLALAAREAIAQWRYQPTLLNGEPWEVETVVTVIFKLKR